jgi:hypothetical protein
MLARIHASLAGFRVAHDAEGGSEEGPEAMLTDPSARKRRASAAAVLGFRTILYRGRSVPRRLGE